MPISLRRKSDASTRSVTRRPQSAASTTKESRASSDASRPLGVPLAPLNEATSRSSPASSPNRPPPSAFRRVHPGAFSSPSKGKEREPPMPLQRPGRAGWIMDPLEARRGAEVWQTSSRVVLILGEPSLAALSPLLYSSAFADTLVLVGSMAPIPDIQALSSPSHLLNTNDGRTIYPTVQNFQPSNKALKDAVHPITALLQQGVALAEAHRRDLGDELTRPPSFGNRSRRGSSASLRSGAMTPPGTPPRRSKLFRFGSSASADGSPSASRNGSAVDLPSMSPGGSGGSRPPSVFEGERASPSLKRRVSSIFRTDPYVSDGTAIDAIVNFIPFARNPQDTQAALREMLHTTVTLTTAALPILSSAVSASSINAQLSLSELAPLSLVHIVPVDAPLTLAPVIEKFLLPILPTMAARVRRPLFGVVTGYGAWLAPSADPANDGVSGAETLLFGGVKCPMQLTGEGARPQALLAGWDHCTSSAGMLVEASGNTDPPPAFSRRASTLALSELRASTAGHEVNNAMPRSSQSVRSSSSQSPPTSPLSPLTPVLPPGAAPARSTSPTQPKTTFPQEAATERMRTPSPKAEKSSSRLAEQTKGGASIRSRTPGKKMFGMRPSSEVGHADPSPQATPTQRPHSQGETSEPISPTRTSPPAQFVSRFDPRWREWEAKAQAKENLRATLSSTSASHNLAAQAGQLPAGAASPSEFGAQERKSRGPSGLRNAVTIPSVQPSPPTPELDPSSSSCSSSSVIETNWSEDRSGASSGSSKRSSAAGSAPAANSKPASGSMSRKPFGFGSIFRRRTVRA